MKRTKRTKRTKRKRSQNKIGGAQLGGAEAAEDPHMADRQRKYYELFALNFRLKEEYNAMDVREVARALGDGKNSLFTKEQVMKAFTAGPEWQDMVWSIANKDWDHSNYPNWGGEYSDSGNVIDLGAFDELFQMARRMADERAMRMEEERAMRMAD